MTSELAIQFFEILNEEGLNYCHWKSNIALSRALTGETDLDLLVERRKLSQITTILLDLAFTPAIEKLGPETPGVSHYYGLDPSIDQLIHIHLFSCVLTGESFVKSHLLPFEQMLLENTEFLDGVRVPSKSAELVIFVLRTFIKYGSLLDVIYLQRNREEIEAELRWLLSGSEVSTALSLLEKYCPVIDRLLFIKCIKTLGSDTSLIERIMVARQVRQRLRGYSKYNVFNRVLAYAELLWERGWIRLRGHHKGKILRNGGAIIAFVGPEATGKSTLVSVCGRWLGSVFAVKMVHAGKPPSSWMTAPINLFLPLLRNLLPRLRTSHLEGHSVSTNPSEPQPKVDGLPSLIYALMAVIVAWDRQNLLLKASRFAANGEIVICDRYPSEAIGVMDSPRLRENPNNGGVMASTYSALTGVERRLYHRIPPPDIVLRLKVSIETAKKRNRERIKAGKESDAYVESRHRHNKEWYRFGTGCVYDIDSEQTQEQTLLCVKKAIWESL